MLAYMAPPWFYGYDIIMEIIFSIITLSVSIFSYRVFKATSQKYAKYLGIAFLSIGLSNIVQSALNFMILSKLNEPICKLMNIQSITFFNTITMYVHIIFFMIGLVFLTYMTFGSENLFILAITMIVSFMGIFLSQNVLQSFYFLASAYLAMISWHFIRNYLKNRKTNTLMIAIAFLFLFFGNVQFVFSEGQQIFYVLGHILELIAYSLILANFLMVRKK